MAVQTLEQAQEILDAKIPRDVVRTREGGGGRIFSYLEGHYVINRMNEVFGQGGWSYTTQEIRQVHTGTVIDKYGKEVHTAHYIATVAVQVPKLSPACVFSDVGYGDGSDKVNIGKAHELAAKEAVTDALKRAVKNLGMSMGLALYSKDQENVSDDKEIQAKAAPEKQSSAGEGNPGRAEGNPSQSVGRPNGKDNETTPTPAAEKGPSREELKKAIIATGRVIVAKKIKTSSDLNEFLIKQYGTDDHNTLAASEAAQFLNDMKGILNGKQEALQH